MAGFEGLTGLNSKLDGLARELGGQASRARLTKVGIELRPAVDEAVRGTLGDLSMSGWTWNKVPIDIRGTSKVISEHEVEISPTPKSRGPMRVLESGRNQGSASGFSGPGIGADGTTARTKSGKVRKVRARKARRWNGVTTGKGTWGHAVDKIVVKGPPAMAKQVNEAMSKIFTRG